MKERNQIITRLIISHVILITGWVSVSLLTQSYRLFLLSIGQIMLCILYLAGYWEFFGMRFKRIFCGLAQLVILTGFVFQLSSGSNELPDWIPVAVPATILAILAYILVKICLVIMKRDKSGVNLEFPFKHGRFLITDSGDSKLSRLMNYHYFFPLHKRNKTNHSMQFAVDIIKFAHNGFFFLPRTNEEYPVFGENI